MKVRLKQQACFERARGDVIKKIKSATYLATLSGMVGLAANVTAADNLAGFHTENLHYPLQILGLLYYLLSYLTITKNNKFFCC